MSYPITLYLLGDRTRSSLVVESPEQREMYRLAGIINDYAEAPDLEPEVVIDDLNSAADEGIDQPTRRRGRPPKVRD